MKVHQGLRNLLGGHPRRKLFTSALGALAIALTVARIAAALQLGNWTVTFNGVTYDHANNTTTVSYTIVGGGTGNGMSHIAFGVCAGILPNEAALVGFSITPPPTGNIVPIVGLDPTTGITGLKLECGSGCTEVQGRGETKTYTYTVNGIWAVDPDGSIGIKAGGQFGLTGTIQGLDCDSINLKLITTCADFSDPEPFYRNVVTEANQNSPANNVVLVDVLTENVEYAGTFASSGVAGTVSCSGDGQNPETVTCTLSQLQDGETWTVDIFVDDNTGGPVSVGHFVEVSADEVEAYNINNEDACSSTTPVTLAYFNAERTGSTVRFAWTTATETGNVGFNLYAVTDAGMKRLNAQLIASEQTDSMSPAAYSFVAKGVTSDRFMIEDVDILANARQHGQFVTGVAYGSPEVGDLIDWDSIHAEDDRLTSERDAIALADTAERIDAVVAARNELAIERDGAEALHASGAGIDAAPIKSAGAVKASAPIARFSVKADGMVRVTYEQLLEAGIDLKSVASNDLALINRGAPVPVRVESVDRLFGPGSSIEFYGEAIDSQYTRTNAYDLVVDSARRVSIGVFRTANKLSGTPAASYVETVVVDRNRAYGTTSSIDDPWYDLRMLVYRSPGSWSVPITVENLATGASTLKFKAWGDTNWPAAPDHHLKAAFNGAPLVDHIFDGLAAFQPEVAMESGVLREGANTLSLMMPGDTGVDYDLINFDSLELRYPRAFVARGGSLSFAAADRLFRVSSLTSANVVVYRFVDGKPPVRYDKVAAVAQPDGTYTATFEGSTEMARYEVLSAAPTGPADVKPLGAPSNIAATATDYLVIAHPNFIGGVQPLVDHHRARGLRVKVVDVRDVYDAYSHGIFDPLGIKAYVKDAKANGVRFVLLVGGDTYDYFNFANPGAMSFIPTLYARTDEIVNHAPVDPQFADVDDDGVPDVAIGRFPVRTTAELDTVVAKTLAYANKTYGQTAVFAADIRDPRVDFSADSDSFIAQLSDGWSVERAYIDDVGLSAARARLLAKLNEGVALTSYIGHSSYSIWTFSGLFRSADAATLTNAGRPTVVTQWGCWNTYFVSPAYNTLGHAFMVSGDRGAAAVLGASTLTEARSEELLGEQMMPRLTAPGATLGEAVLAAKQAMAVKHPHRADVLLGWTVLGDPALQVAP